MGGGRLTEPVDWRPGPEDAAEAADLAAHVRAAVVELPPGQRAAVLLYYFQSLSHAEIAAHLGTRVGAIKARLYYARRTLRQRLQVLGGEWEMPTPQENPFLEMRIADVRRRRATGDQPRLHVVILEELGGQRTLPIWMGPFEGESLAMQVRQVAIARPLTYTFLAGLLQAGDLRLQAVHISRLVGDTFYAEAVLEGPAGQHTVDARPSDALNLALAVGAPVRVAADVLADWTAEAAAWRAQHPSDPDVWTALERMEGAEAIVAEITGRWTRPTSTTEGSA